MREPSSEMSIVQNASDVRAGESPSTITRGSVIARLERLPANAMLVRARVLIGLATFFDGFDVIAIAATLPILIGKWHLSPWDVGFLIGASSVGQLLGAFVFPWYAERHGRVRAIALSSGVIGVTSIACGMAPSFAVFLVLRILQGIGLGGELPVAATYINEICRAHGRGRFVLLYEIVFPVGLLAANALGAWIVPRFGWEAMYFMGGVPLILFLFLRKLVPESPRWLAERGRLQEAGHAVHTFERTVKGPLAPLEDVDMFEAMASGHSKRRIKDLFGRVYWRRSAAVAMLWMTCGVIQYGLSTWLPTIYRDVYHAPLQLALNLAVAGSILGVIGSLACALVVDIVGRKPVIVCSFVLCALSLFLAAIFHQASVYVVATCCALCLGWLACGFITAYVYTPELYPTSIRAFGCGVGGAWLKLAAIFAPTLVSKAMVGGHLNIAFYALGLFPLLAAFVVYFLGIETKGKVLEQLEA